MSRQYTTSWWVSRRFHLFCLPDPCGSQGGFMLLTPFSAFVAMTWCQNVIKIVPILCKWVVSDNEAAIKMQSEMQTWIGDGFTLLIRVIIIRIFRRRGRRRRLHIMTWVFMDDHQSELWIHNHHDLMLFTFDAQHFEVILGIYLPHCTTGHNNQIRNFLCIFCHLFFLPWTS